MAPFRLPDNLRSKLINWAGESVLKSATAPLLFLEIGAMFTMEEGASTYFLARLAAQGPRGSRVISIEALPEHIEAARRLIGELDPSLLDRITFHQAMSFEVLPRIVAENPRFDLLWLDGGAHPEVCLREFEMLIPRLSQDGFCLVDDCCHVPPSKAYPFQRPLGKANLILPMVAIGQYLAERKAVLERTQLTESDRTRKEPRRDFVSPLIESLSGASPFPSFFQGLHYRVVMGQNTGSLVVARKPFELPPLDPKPFPALAQALRRAAGSVVRGVCASTPSSTRPRT